MRTIDTLVIGAGQAGLALSRCLTDAGVEHLVLERGRIGERWRSERWDSLRLLTPRWLSGLPGWSYGGPDPEGFMHKDELIDSLEGYARSFVAPVATGVTVTAVEPWGDRFRVGTDREDWIARHVVIATGECDRPSVPGLARGLPEDVEQVVTTRYRNPSQLPDGGVLVVGASSTGVQLAAEIHASGRPVTLAVGQHTRLPRRYRGRDILWWLDRMGLFEARPDEVKDLEASRGQPSLQLVGSRDHRTLDLAALHRGGVRLTGRLVEVEGPRVRLADDLLDNTVSADVKLARLRMRIDEHARRIGIDAEPGEPFEPVRLPDPATRLDLRAEGIRTVVWATGFRRSYPWLRVPVLDGRGEIRHAGGLTPWPGLYVLGLSFMRRRSSTFIRGCGRDAVEVAEHLLERRRRSGRGAA